MSRPFRLDAEGRLFLAHRLAELEASLIEQTDAYLSFRGYRRIAVPSLLRRETFERQGVVPWAQVLRVSEDLGLAGSAEQGILELFTGARVEVEEKLYATNQCFRREANYLGLKYLREFRKVEQFVFCEPREARARFEEMLSNAMTLLKVHGIPYRIVDVGSRDSGYHRHKVDLEVKTETYGWLETHSCTDYGTAQASRFDITGPANHTVSCTGVASPRILVPLIERDAELRPALVLDPDPLTTAP